MVSWISPIKVASAMNVCVSVCESASSVHYHYYCIFSVFHRMVGYHQYSLYILVFCFYIILVVP
jgi:hypothetical protein